MYTTHTIEYPDGTRERSAYIEGIAYNLPYPTAPTSLEYWKVSNLTKAIVMNWTNSDVQSYVSDVLDAAVVDYLRQLYETGGVGPPDVVPVEPTIPASPDDAGGGGTGIPAPTGCLVAMAGLFAITAILILGVVH